MPQSVERGCYANRFAGEFSRRRPTGVNRKCLGPATPRPPAHRPEFVKVCTTMWVYAHWNFEETLHQRTMIVCGAVLCSAQQSSNTSVQSWQHPQLEDGALVPASCESILWNFSIGPTCPAGQCHRSRVAFTHESPRQAPTCCFPSARCSVPLALSLPVSPVAGSPTNCDIVFHDCAEH